MRDKKETDPIFLLEPPYTKGELVIFKDDIYKVGNILIFKEGKPYPVKYETQYVYRMISEDGRLWYMPKDNTKMIVKQTKIMEVAQ